MLGCLGPLSRLWAPAEIVGFVGLVEYTWAGVLWSWCIWSLVGCCCYPSCPTVRRSATPLPPALSLTWRAGSQGVRVHLVPNAPPSEGGAVHGWITVAHNHFPGCRHRRPCKITWALWRPARAGRFPGGSRLLMTIFKAVGTGAHAKIPWPLWVSLERRQVVPVHLVPPWVPSLPFLTHGS